MDAGNSGQKPRRLWRTRDGRTNIGLALFLLGEVKPGYDKLAEIFEKGGSPGLPRTSAFASASGMVLPVIQVLDGLPPGWAAWEQDQEGKIELEGLLGRYIPADERIELFEEGIAGVARSLKVDASCLRKVVLLHELAHWLCHVVPLRGTSEATPERWPLEAYNAGSEDLHEGLANFLCQRAAAATGLEPVFNALLKRSPSAYQINDLRDLAPHDLVKALPALRQMARPSRADLLALCGWGGGAGAISGTVPVMRPEVQAALSEILDPMANELTPARWLGSNLTVTKAELPPEGADSIRLLGTLADCPDFLAAYNLREVLEEVWSFKPGMSEVPVRVFLAINPQFSWQPDSPDLPSIFRKLWTDEALFFRLYFRFNMAATTTAAEWWGSPHSSGSPYRFLLWDIVHEWSRGGLVDHEAGALSDPRSYGVFLCWFASVLSEACSEPGDKLALQDLAARVEQKIAAKAPREDLVALVEGMSEVWRRHSVCGDTQSVLMALLASPARGESAGGSPAEEVGVALENLIDLGVQIQGQKAPREEDMSAVLRAGRLLSGSLGLADVAETYAFCRVI